ncbi:hypothetical protein M5X11_33205 [Paenibacillus alginolyticus]|uniref:Lipoprotein n=1 Tax=Paenibacillus alginolyticus TaxID=59839 RepID=A0ABT4G9C7_9BACL|nr:hypothetical protein [Paenibacillus alginolyticus]MCY9669717.1 hypothetical protein [Paenibacillus alginolyticus]MCY9692790.1 hypothetical protein [Paenibacillus alginolyticus]MEC0146111.1 hypothetical protein [Paenibacillus alginolyticus]
MKGSKGFGFERLGLIAALLLLGSCTYMVYVVVASFTEIKQPYFIVYIAVIIAVVIIARK